MKTLPSNFLPPTARTSAFATVDLDDAQALEVARSLQPHPEAGRRHFLIDCGNLVCQRTLGVNHVVSQLLVLRKAGAVIWLRNVNATLGRCLKVLQLNSLFRTTANE